jgi:hypothetical protein
VRNVARFVDVETEHAQQVLDGVVEIFVVESFFDAGTEGGEKRTRYE